MDKNYLECLEHIIEIEKNCYTQEKLITSLDKKIETLAIPKKINMPQKIDTYIPPVEYNVENVKHDTNEFAPPILTGGVILGIAGIIIGYTANAPVAGMIFGAIAGIIIGAIVETTTNSLNESKAALSNENAQKAAQEEWEKLSSQQRHIDEQNFERELKKHKTLTTFEKNRVAAEGEKKKELFYSKEELIQKHEETKKTTYPLL